MVIVITGPTGVGKTKLSLKIAKHYETEIISGDSMQIYKTLDIGTAKVTKEEQSLIPHHMIDILSPQESFSVALYQKKVRSLIETFKANNKIPLIVGGTGFYIKSVLHDFNFEAAHPDEAFLKEHESLDSETLYDKLNHLDLEAAKIIHPNNKKRIIQALYRAQNNVKRSNTLNAEKPLYDYCLIVLRRNRETLYQIINERVDQMIEQGLVEEAKTLYRNHPSLTAKKAIGYKELFEYFKGNISLDEAIELIKRNTRRYAKRQFTYFYNQFEPNIIDVDNKPLETIQKEAVNIIENSLNKK